MGLSCSCDFDTYDYTSWWEDHSEFKPLKFLRRKRCVSCKDLIDVGSDVVEFYRYLMGIYPEGTEINYHAHIDMKTADNMVVPWLCSQTDMLANDWMIAN